MSPSYQDQALQSTRNPTFRVSNPQFQGTRQEYTIQQTSKFNDTLAYIGGSFKQQIPLYMKLDSQPTTFTQKNGLNIFGKPSHPPSQAGSSFLANLANNTTGPFSQPKSQNLGWLSQPIVTPNQTKLPISNPLFSTNPTNKPFQSMFNKAPTSVFGTLAQQSKQTVPLQGNNKPFAGFKLESQKNVTDGKSMGLFKDLPIVGQTGSNPFFGTLFRKDETPANGTPLGPTSFITPASTNKTLATGFITNTNAQSPPPVQILDAKPQSKNQIKIDLATPVANKPPSVTSLFGGNVSSAQLFTKSTTQTPKPATPIFSFFKNDTQTSQVRAPETPKFKSQDPPVQTQTREVVTQQKPVVSFGFGNDGLNPFLQAVAPSKQLPEPPLIGNARSKIVNFESKPIQHNPPVLSEAKLPDGAQKVTFFTPQKGKDKQVQKQKQKENEEEKEKLNERERERTKEKDRQKQASTLHNLVAPLAATTPVVTHILQTGAVPAQHAVQTPKPTSILQVQPKQLVSHKPTIVSFLSCKQIVNIISQKCSNKQQLKEFVMQRHIMDILLFKDNSEFKITGENFSISSKAMPQFPQTNVNLKRYLFDLTGCFKSLTNFSDHKCLSILQNFLCDVKYYETFRSGTMQPKEEYFQTKEVYEQAVDGGVRLNTLSYQVSHIMEMMIDQGLIMASLLCKGMSMIQQAFTAGQFLKTFSKQQLLVSYSQHYFGLISKPHGAIDSDIAQCFYSRKKIQAKNFSKFLNQKIQSLNLSDVITNDLLFMTIDTFDEYMGSDNLVVEMINRDRQIQVAHQHILLSLLEFKKLKVKAKSVWSRFSDLETKIRRTKSKCLLPFRDILPQIGMIDEVHTENIHPDFKRVLGFVDGPEWVHWMDIYLKRANIPSPEFQILSQVLEKVYSTDQNLTQLMQVNNFEQYTHPLFRHIQNFKKTRNHRIQYRIYRIMLGTKSYNQSEEVIVRYIKDQEWVQYILKPMLFKFKETALNQVVLTENSQDTDSKIQFLLRLIQLNPQKVHYYGNKVFKSGNTATLQLIVFVLDCLNYYVSPQVKNFRMAACVFKCLNQLLLEPTTRDNFLYCVGLYQSFSETDPRVHILLRFIPDLNKLQKNEANELIGQIKSHLEILLDMPYILLIAPQKSSFENLELTQKFKHRYVMSSRQQLWGVLSKSVNPIPSSPWVRSIAGILKCGNPDFRVIGNILRKFLFKTGETYNLQVPYLDLIRDILNQVPIVENLLKAIELAANSSMHAILKRNQMYDLLRQNHTQEFRKIQDALYLLFVLLNLHYSANKIKSQDITNYYSTVVGTLKCLFEIQESFLSTFKGFVRQDSASHAIVNLFGLINFQAQRLLPTSNNPTLEKSQDKPFVFRSPDIRQIQEDMDYNYLANPLNCPLNKNYLAIQSVSINALRVLTVLAYSCENSINLTELFKESISLGVYETSIRLLSQSLLEFESNQEESILALELVQYLLKYQSKFVEPILSSTSIFQYLDNYLKSPVTSIVLFQKTAELVVSLMKMEHKKIVNDKLALRDYKLLLINKLKGIGVGTVKRLESVMKEDNTDEIVERVIVQRSLVDHARFMHSVEVIIQITVLSIFRRERPIQYLKSLLDFLVKNQLLSTLNVWQLVYPDYSERVSNYQLVPASYPIRNYFSSAIVVNHMANFRNDPQETHLLNCINKVQQVYRHIPATVNNIHTFLRTVSQSCYKSIYNMLIFLLNCNNDGYFMSTQPLPIQKSSTASPLYCQFHQPKISFTFMDVFSHNREQAMDFIKCMVRQVLDNLWEPKYQCNYPLAIRLLSTYLHALVSDKRWDANGMEVVTQLLKRTEWITEDKNGIASNPVSAKAILELLMLVRQYNLPATLVDKLQVVVTNSLKMQNLLPETKTNLLASLIPLIKLGSPVKLDVADLLAEHNSTYFYSIIRVLIEYSRTHASSLVKVGVLSLLARHTTLSKINQTLVFYTNGSRSEAQLSWVWTLTLLKHLVFFQGSNPLVMNDVLTFLGVFNQRILNVLDRPCHREFQYSYGYIEELESTLDFLNICFRVFSNMPMAVRTYLQRIQYSLLHNTVILLKQFHSPFVVSPQTASQRKLNSLTPLKQTLKKNVHPPTVFSLTLQAMYINCVSYYSGLLESCLKQSEFVRNLFQKTLEGTNIMYTNYIWVHTNRNMNQIQGNLISLNKQFSECASNVFQTNQQAWKSPELFSANGYLASIKTYPSKTDILASLQDAYYLMTRMNLIYLKQQSLYRQKYLSLVPEDIEDFRVQQVKFIKNATSTRVSTRKEPLRRWSYLLQRFNQLAQAGAYL